MLYPESKSQPFVKHYLRSLLKLVLFFLVIMQIFRLGFVVTFVEPLQIKTNFKSFIEAWWLGTRFDLIIIAYISLIPFLMIFIGFYLRFSEYLKTFPRLLILYFYLVFFVFSFVMIGDFGFYVYFQDHINVLFFGLWEDDTKAVITSIWKNYNVPLYALVLTIYLGGSYYYIYRCFKMINIDSFLIPARRKVLYPFYFMITLTLIAFLGRGNFSRLPLSLEDAHISDITSINHMSINGFIALNRAYKIRKVFGGKDADFVKLMKYQGQKEVIQDYLGYHNITTPYELSLNDVFSKRTPIKDSLKESPKHVVVFIMESFGAYWWDQQSDDFDFLGSFKSHTQEDILFLNFLPADNGTIGSVNALVSGLPLRPGARFLSEGQYMKTSLPSAAHMPYKNAGYETSFYYGGKLGWRQLGTYLNILGLDNLMGADQIISELRLSEKLPSYEIGNEWGVFDEHLISMIKKRLSQSFRPQFIMVLTTSNHPPFETPSTYQGKDFSFSRGLLDQFSKEEEEIRKRFKTLQYANTQLGDFISWVKSSELKKKVTVAATGDHSFWVSKDQSYENLLKRFSVPFYLYLPSDIRPKDWNPKAFGGHIDIMPTLYQLTLSDQEYFSLGQSMFDSRGIGINVRPLVAHQDGVYASKLFYCWRDSSFTELNKCEGEGHSYFNYYRSLIALTDLYLKSQSE